jgi:uncharacterized protein (DUF2267 family)
MSMRLMCRSLTVVKRCLSALDSLEDKGAAVNMIRADLSALADELELENENRLAAARRNLEAREEMHYD